MANRFNETNNVGFVTINSNTVIGPDNYTDQYTAPQYITVASPPLQAGGDLLPGGVTFLPAIWVTANGHLVERGGDMGLYDTVSAVAVDFSKCSFALPGSTNQNYPNV